MNNGLDWDNPSGFRRIIARVGESRGGPAAARRSTAVLAYARNIGAGEIVQASDLVWSKEAVAAADSPRDSDAVIGMAARRPLREGSAVTSHDVAAAMVIKRDDVVRIAYDADGVSLSLQAKATQAAAVGDVFTAINPTSKKVIQAVCTGPGEAVVGPRAEQLRAAAQSDPRVYASLR
jgi:flagella basal body P-ring formation protein FlgA